MAKNNKNPVSQIIKFYEEQVKKHDKDGNVDLYKDAAEAFFKLFNKEWAGYCSYLKNVIKTGYNELTFEDIEYLDGYFIFGFGSNSVIHFRIKEIPGWKFAIWWGQPEKEDRTWTDDKSVVHPAEWLHVKGELFCQYEENIDKFKPSRSEYLWNISVDLNPQGEFQFYNYRLINELAFMINEPELAFCRDYCGWNYNEEYHTRAEAKKEYIKYRTWTDNKNKFEKICDERSIAAIKELLKDNFENGTAIIHDRGENWSPRYEVFLNLDALEKHEGIEEGCYHLSEFFKKTDSDFKAYTTQIKECEKIARKQKFYWSNPIGQHLELRGKKSFEKIKKIILSGSGEN